MSLRHRLEELRTSTGLEARRLRRVPCPAVLVLMYHEVLPDSVDLPSWLVVRESAFLAQMTWLRKHFEVVSPDAALARLRSSAASTPAHRPLAIVTFDDGYAGNLNCVLPIMRQLELPFTVYVATVALQSDRRFWHDDLTCALLKHGRGSLDIQTSQGLVRFKPTFGLADWRWTRVNTVLDAVKRLPLHERCSIADSLDGRRLWPELRMLRRTELLRLSRDPLVSIGNHTQSHELLDQLSPEEARSTILAAQRELTECAGTVPRHFCYPNGNYLPETLQVVRELGFATATTTVPGIWTDPSRALEIPRMSVGRFDTLARFRQRALGLAMARSS